MKFHKVVARLPANPGDPAVVEIDGRPLRNWTAIEIKADMKNVTSVTVTFMAEVNVEAEAEVE